MSWRKAVLFLMVAAILLPVTAKADALQFGLKGGYFNVTTAIGSGILTNDPSVNVGPCGKTNTCQKAATLSTIGTKNLGIKFGPGNFGSVVFTTGTALSTVLYNKIIYPKSLKYSQVTFGAGGNITVTSSVGLNGIGGFIPAGSVLFSGVFTSNQVFKVVNLANPFGSWSLGGLLNTTTLNPILLADLGLPFLNHGTFTSLQLDVSFKLKGGVVQSGLITLVPEPATLSLFGTGLVALAGLLRKRLK